MSFVIITTAYIFQMCANSLPTFIFTTSAPLIIISFVSTIIRKIS